ncbi:GNAT family N-acetyltransferase [Nonomuraea sp. NN258]|uniref:GNAT family N-acetyltransferase n=1 Tax=Nonomuraea antri TaxID=2730852 RepID=UPI0015685249|nr:GNAT family N-acetyltransferase [Nonomuraea antri]NRQ34923.1 GNAT family N-acetyltransferase [Nonomuraea antri]
MLRRVQNRDLPEMLRWRNHPRVRAASFSTHEIPAAEHAQWWADTSADPGKQVLIYDHGERPAGVVSYTGLHPESRSGYWGYYLDLDGLEQAGALLEAWVELEREAIDHAFGPLGLTALRGEVLADNEPVRRLHQRFGFSEVGAYQRCVDGMEREVIAIQLTKEGQE